MERMIMSKYNEHPSGFIHFLFGKYADYIRRLKPLFITCLFLFFFSLVMGYYLGEGISQQIFEELLGRFPDPTEIGIIDLFGFLIVNNLSFFLIFMLLGLLFSVPSIFYVVINGFVIGIVVNSVIAELGLAYVIIGLLPHGIIEIPSLLLSMAVGMSLGYQVINRVRGRSGLGEELRIALSLYMWRIAPLLIFAAVIEVTITPLLLSFMGIG
jgi:stage II sporulation protein M